jgi:ABC-type multidrug transport system fused ATPase/permease subunit
LTRPDSGRVWVNRSVAYLPQSSQLMSGTLLDNIVYPAATGDRSKAARALVDVGLDDFVESLEMPVGNLSGGQIQRVFLARLIYLDAKIVLVDEGTSALDPEIEQAVYTSLRKLAASGACVVMIAHRLSALEHCDEVLLMNSGKICESGSYADMRKSQNFQNLMQC